MSRFVDDAASCSDDSSSSSLYSAPSADSSGGVHLEPRLGIAGIGSSCSPFDVDDDDVPIVFGPAAAVVAVVDDAAPVLDPGVAVGVVADPVDDLSASFMGMFGEDVAASDPKKRARNYVFTLNNYTLEEECGLRGSADVNKVRYLAFGREVGRNGTPHLQGVICLYSAATFVSLKTLEFPVRVCSLKRAWFAVMRGTPEQAVAYCKKDAVLESDFFEEGDMPISAKRKGEMEKKRWAEARELAYQGKFEEIDPDIYLKSHAGLKFARARFLSTRALEHLGGELCNFWIWGAAGLGKSRRARLLARRASGHEVFAKDINKWWPDYNDETDVLIEDWDKSHEKLHTRQLKVWADRYVFAAEAKNTHFRVRPQRLYVTSNHYMPSCFECAETLDAIQRRFRIEHMQPPENGVPFVWYPDEYVTYRCNPIPWKPNEFKVWEVIDKDRFKADYPEGLPVKTMADVFPPNEYGDFV